MKSPYLMEHFGQIDKKFILEAEPPKKVGFRTKHWGMIAAMAACAVLVVLSATMLYRHLTSPQEPVFSQKPVLPQTTDYQTITPETNGTDNEGVKKIPLMTGTDAVKKIPVLTGKEDYLLEALTEYPEFFIDGVYLGENMNNVIADFGEPDNIIGWLNHGGLLCNYDDFSVYCVPTTAGWQINRVVCSTTRTSEIPFGWQFGTTTWQDILSQISDNENISYSDRFDGNPACAQLRFKKEGVQVGLGLKQELEKPSNMATRLLMDIWFEYNESCYKDT